MTTATAPGESIVRTPTSYLPEALFEMGYKDLISIAPPNAPISPGSKLQPQALGKVPARRNTIGKWSGYQWLVAEHSIDDVRQWETSGANVGLRTRNFPALDIDSRDPKIADQIELMARETLGWAPVRFGQKPKRLMLYSTCEPFGRLRVWGTRGNSGSPDGERHLIEVLGDGQQFRPASLRGLLRVDRGFARDPA
jgi:hypothetical protein